MEFPKGWSPVQAQPDHTNHLSLFGSACWQMGSYFAKAQAMQRVPEIHRAVKMTRTRKGKFGAFGQTVMRACEEMHGENIPLQGDRASLRVLQFLADQGQAELDPPKIGGEDAPSSKIGRFIGRFLRERGLYVGKTRSAKDAR